MSGTRTPRYAPAVVRQRLMAMAIGIVVLVILVQIAQAIIGIVYVGGLATPPEGWRESYDATLTASGALRVLATLVGGGFYVAWQRRVTRNLLSFGVTDLSPGLELSSWSWIIPFANLIVPLLNARQVARESAPAGERSAASLAGWWWASWIGGAVWTVAANALFLRAEESGPWIAATTVVWISYAIMVSAGVLVILMSARITRQQERRIRQLRQAAELPVAEPAT